MKKIFICIILINIFNYSYCNSPSKILDNSLNIVPNNIINQQIKSTNNKKIINKIIAIVNHQPITFFELNEEITKIKATQKAINPYVNTSFINLKKKALNNLIDQSIIMQLAKQENINISNYQVDEIIKDIASKNSIDEESLKLSIEASGISFDSYKDKIRKQLMLNELQKQTIFQQIYVSPEEIKEYITKHQEEFDREMKPITIYTLKNFIVTLPYEKIAREKAINKFTKLNIAVNRGLIDFSEMTKQYSEAPNSSSGGKLSQQVQFDSIPEIYKNHVKDLKKNKVSKPFIIKNTLQMIYIDNIYEHKPKISRTVKKYYLYGIKIYLSRSITEKNAKYTLNHARLAIKNGQNFSQIAEKYNQDYEHANGEFKWISQLDTPPSMSQAIFTQLKQLKEGEISEAFQADAKTWMIIKYTKVKEYDAIKELEAHKALEAIFAKKVQVVYKKWLKLIKDDAYINILQN